MPRPSSISRLPAEIRDKIGALRAEGRTIDEIVAKLEELNVDVSRSALGRHCKRLESVQANIRQSRQIADAIVRNYGEDKENKLARVNMEILHGLIFQLMSSEDGEPVVISSKDASCLATAIEKLTKAAKADVEKEIAITAEFKEKAERQLQSVARRKGLSSETVDMVRREILGGL